jgi:RNA polymerase sigma-70 factor (ECF subfamily)
MDEKTLIKACKNAEVSAFKILYERYYAMMFGICLRYVRNKADAEDLVQEGFMKVFKDVGAFEGKGSFEGWLKRVMINHTLSFLRKTKKEFAYDNIDSIAGNEAEQIEEDDITIENKIKNSDFTKEELIEIIQSLPPGYQQVLNLYIIDGYKHHEIAKMLNISEGTSKSQLNRGRKLAISKLYKKVGEKELMKIGNSNFEEKLNPVKLAHHER